MKLPWGYPQKLLNKMTEQEKQVDTLVLINSILKNHINDVDKNTKEGQLIHEFYEKLEKYFGDK